jgi:hypothetical protein
MSEIENLIKRYQRFVSVPWESNMAGPEKVWFAVYDPPQERRLRLRLPEFRIATQAAGYKWREFDLTPLFAQWMAGHRYRETYFEEPENMDLALKSFTGHVAQQIRAALTHPDVDAQTVVAIYGAASLFGLTKVSDVLEKVTSHIRGRLLLFFPGRYEGSIYRLLDARDGWNYLAIPITAAKR